MLWLAAMALTPPALPPPDCSAGVLGDYCDGCVDLEDRTRRISCMWGDLLTEGCCNGAETSWPGGLSDYTRISSYCLEELELPQVCEPPAGAPPTCVCPRRRPRRRSGPRRPSTRRRRRRPRRRRRGGARGGFEALADVGFSSDMAA